MKEAELAHLELCRRKPMYFRDNLILLGQHGEQKFESMMSDFQRTDFKAVDPCLQYLVGVRKKKPDKQRFWIQRARGWSKTTDWAINVIYLSAFSERKLDGFIAAEDKEQAALLRNQLEKVIQLNRWLENVLDVQRWKIVNKITRAEITILTRDVGSSFGLTPDFVICDEFTHWTQEDFWSSLFSSFAKKADAGAMLAVLCNAGKGKGWQYQVREMARTDPLWYYSAPEGVAPWYTQQTIEEQRRGLTQTEFKRLWMNQWQESGGDFVTVEEADACIDSKLAERDTCEQKGWTYIASLDFAEKHDRTVGTVGHVWNGKVVVDRMDVIDPESIEGTVRVEWCKNWMRNIVRDFGGGDPSRIHFVVDEYQLLSVIQELEDEGFYIHRFESKGKGTFELALILRQMILHETVTWYEGCGRILDPRTGEVWNPQWGRDDLGTELGDLIVKPLPGGRWRMDHEPNKHDDRAVSLGMMLWYVVMNDGGMDYWSISASKDGHFNLGAFK